MRKFIKRDGIGDKRTRSGFLFIPKKIIPSGEDGEVRWLEYAYWEEEYITFPSGYVFWRATRWVEQVDK
jgi:hypothetical protein